MRVPSSKSPTVEENHAFGTFLEVIGQIAEEVDAREALQFIDAHHVLAQAVAAPVFVDVLHPEAHGFVALAVAAENGHEEVFGHDESLGCLREDLVGIVDGAALADVERVDGLAVVLEIVGDEILHLQPQTCIELVALRLHV